VLIRASTSNVPRRNKSGQDRRALQCLDLAVRAAHTHAKLREVLRQVLGQALGERGDKHALTHRNALADAHKQEWPRLRQALRRGRVQQE
jgi:hypothetical protein